MNLEKGRLGELGRMEGAENVVKMYLLSEKINFQLKKMIQKSIHSMLISKDTETTNIFHF